MPTHYIWFQWSLVLIAIWFVLYLLLPTGRARQEMFTVSLWTALLGITEPFFVPTYWLPPSLFDLAARTGFDIESFIFSFGIGGVAIVLYHLLFRTRDIAVPHGERSGRRHRYHLIALMAAPIIFLVLYFGTSLNPIYSTIIALYLGGFATWYCRPDLKLKMITSAFLFLALYAAYFFVLIAMAPGYVAAVWNLKVLSGVLVFGIPLEELAFASGFGFLWSSVYEHFAWKEIARRRS